MQYVVNRTQSIIQTRILLLIALLAATRKVIILDLKEMGVGPTLGLGAIILVLGTTYWLICERDDRLPDAKTGGVGEEERADGHEPPAVSQMRPASAAAEKTTTH